MSNRIETREVCGPIHLEISKTARKVCVKDVAPVGEWNPGDEVRVYSKSGLTLFMSFVKEGETVSATGYPTGPLSSDGWWVRRSSCNPHGSESEQENCFGFGTDGRLDYFLLPESGIVRQILDPVMAWYRVFLNH